MIRASSLGDFCGRRIQLGRELGRPISPAVGADKLWLFSKGSGIHYQLQNEIGAMIRLESGETLLNGWWRCFSCGSVITGPENPDADAERMPDDVLATAIVCRDVGGVPTTPHLSFGWTPRPCECPTCGQRDGARGSEFEYVEMSIHSSRLRLSGHIDAVFVWEDGYTEVTDYKGANERTMSKVDSFFGGSAKESNVIQVHAYQLLTGIEGGRVVYVARDDSDLKSALGEHECPRTPETDQMVVDALAEAIRYVDDDGSLPLADRLDACTSKTRLPASGCSCKTPCFRR